MMLSYTHLGYAADNAPSTVQLLVEELLAFYVAFHGVVGVADAVAGRNCGIVLAYSGEPSVDLARSVRPCRTVARRRRRGIVHGGCFSWLAVARSL